MGREKETVNRREDVGVTEAWTILRTRISLDWRWFYGFLS